MTRLKFAELTSGIGALVLGVGLGAMFQQWFTPAAGVIVLAGASAHGFGMWDKHRLDRDCGALGRWWVAALYWICWLLLAGVVVLLIVRS